MKTTKILIFALGSLIVSLSAPSIAQNYNFKILDNVRVSKSIPQDDSSNLFDENLKTPSKKKDPVPVCEVNYPVGELDCFDRLYVDRQMLNQLVDGSVVYSNEGQPFDSYAHNQINTYHVTDMSSLFYNKTVGFDIYEWDVSNVNNMRYMFVLSIDFNQPIVNWDVSNVINMSFVFYGTRRFNQPIGNWNVRNVTNMSYMFANNTSTDSLSNDFNQNLNDWDVCDLEISTYFIRNATSLTSDNMPYFDKRNCP